MTTFNLLLMLARMHVDYAVIMYVIGLMPLLAAVAAVCWMLAARPPKDDGVWRENERHLSPVPPVSRPAHRHTSPRAPAGRHRPARGERLKGLSRQAQLEECTVQIDRGALLDDAARIRADARRALGDAHIVPHAAHDMPIASEVREDFRRMQDAVRRDVARAFDVPMSVVEPPHEHKPYRDGVRLRCRTCSLDLPEPRDMPSIGPHGFASWS